MITGKKVTCEYFQGEKIDLMIYQPNYPEVVSLCIHVFNTSIQTERRSSKWAGNYDQRRVRRDNFVAIAY